jgi:hypothetical protein
MTSACEILPSGLPRPLDGAAGPDRHWRGRLQWSSDLKRAPLAGPADDSLEVFWKFAVRKYTGCALSYGSDKLKALWGVVKLLRDALGEEYGDGMWQTNLEEQLAWRVAECSLEERPNSQGRIPSWSWASMSGTIELQERLPANERGYVVKDHEGRSISFKVKRPGTQESAPATAEKVRRANAAVSAQDRQPELKDLRIAMQAHIGHARLWYDISKRKWRLRIPSPGRTNIDDAIFEVFPDTKPQSEEPCIFIVLAASSVRQRRPFSNTISLQTGLYGCQIVGEEEPEEIRFSGVGITLKPIGKNHHFHRTGALHFRDISVEAWQCLRATYCRESDSHEEWDDVKGLKFWLC